jgi:adenylate kinase family enzyme
MMRLILLGNAGAGKSTMARQIIGDATIRRLSLDEIAWDEGPKRKSLEASLRLLHDFIQRNEEWIIEGCYSDLVEAALPYCTELRFLNPGVEVCVAHCHRRPWEPEKFPSPEDQTAMLAQLIQWVMDYEARDDACGLKRHRQVFDRFTGQKREYVSVEAYFDPANGNDAV